MTPAQKLEAKRLTPFMRYLLRAISQAPAPGGCPLPDPHCLRSARILERRGFVQIQQNVATLTPAGNEVVTILRCPS